MFCFRHQPSKSQAAPIKVAVFFVVVETTCLWTLAAGQGFMRGRVALVNLNLNESETLMSLLFYAQPYDISAEGFYFRSVEEYQKKASTLRNSYGQPVEEFEIQFIDGDLIDCELAKAWGLNQVNLQYYLDAVDDWDWEEIVRFIIAVGHNGYAYDHETSCPADLDVSIYQIDSMRELAIKFVENGLFGEIPERLQFYIDYDAIARDLSVDYSEAIIAGERLIYRCN